MNDTGMRLICGFLRKGSKSTWVDLIPNALQHAHMILVH